MGIAIIAFDTPMRLTWDAALLSPQTILVSVFSKDSSPSESQENNQKSVFAPHPPKKKGQCPYVYKMLLIKVHVSPKTKSLARIVFRWNMIFTLNIVADLSVRDDKCEKKL